jgi:hypothetical protein
MPALRIILPAALLAWLITACCCLGGLDDADDEAPSFEVAGHSEGGGGDV